MVGIGSKHLSSSIDIRKSSRGYSYYATLSETDASLFQLKVYDKFSAVILLKNYEDNRIEGLKAQEATTTLT